MASVTLYHNSRCSKSRQALALLNEKGVDVTVIEYLKTPPSLEDLQNLMLLLCIKDPRAMMRTKEPLYRDLDLANEGLTEDELIAAIHEHPILLERPIVVKGDHGVIGRPTEAILRLL